MDGWMDGWMDKLMDGWISDEGSSVGERNYLSRKSMST